MVEYLRAVADQLGGGDVYRTLYTRAYREYRVLCGFNAVSRAKNASLVRKRKVRPIEILEEEGQLGKFYAFLTKFWPLKTAS